MDDYPEGKADFDLNDGEYIDECNIDSSVDDIIDCSIESSIDMPKPPVINAAAAIVMDRDTGRILYEKNAHKKLPIASTTKIMTGIIAIEKGNLDDTVTVSKRARQIWGSVIGLYQGEKIKLRELLYGLMLNSGNDAAIAIAEHIGGTVENFLEMMNEKARLIGARNTNFKSPHGLDMDGHYSTAYD
ncbi:MAG: D-alanyl-D-alanine carboxypeptidase, partial [Clostridiaceae bacterium]|nr:D-alanyl-D-alanine carboxypeptidase [Clostridiaceae bacterium]